jgi:hypothetical protein
MFQLLNREEVEQFWKTVTLLGSHACPDGTLAVNILSYADVNALYWFRDCFQRPSPPVWYIVLRAFAHTTISYAFETKNERPFEMCPNLETASPLYFLYSNIRDEFARHTISRRVDIF